MRLAWPISASPEWLLLVACICLPFSLPAQESSKQGEQTRRELQEALRLARDAVIRLAAEDDSTVNGAISEKVKKLSEFLLYVDDSEDVRYLQQHLKKVYADQIRNALEPSATIQDFAVRVSKADGVKQDFEHDEDLRTIVAQEIERGFTEDAVNAARKIRLPGSRSSAFIDIALALHSKGNDSAAAEAVTAAIQACFQPRTGLPLVIEPPDRQLDQIATALADKYPEGAYRAFAEAEKAVDAKEKTNSFDWSSLTGAAIAVGDLPSAARLIQKVDDVEQQANLRTQLSLVQARQAGPDAEVRAAAKIRDPWTKISTLRGVADEQSEAGDSNGAITTLRLAIDFANRAEERTVLLLHDLAWAQIDAGDRVAAEQTLDLALKENEKSAFGADQVNGWTLLADAFAFLGDFDRAHKIALKIDDHYFRGRALGFIAQREVEAGLSEKTLRWAAQLEDPDERASSYLAIAGAMIDNLKSGNRD
jgi:tetratricopeptide (TPR) repeat protein